LASASLRPDSPIFAHCDDSSGIDAKILDEGRIAQSIDDRSAPNHMVNHFRLLIT
jgi:hypothetical protein